jgi:hypothetical protein
MSLDWHGVVKPGLQTLFQSGLIQEGALKQPLAPSMFMLFAAAYRKDSNPSCAGAGDRVAQAGQSIMYP